MVYKLNNTEFKTKKDIQLFYQKFLKNDYLHKEINGEDKDILLDLFTNHTRDKLSKCYISFLENL